MLRGKNGSLAFNAKAGQRLGQLGCSFDYKFKGEQVLRASGGGQRTCVARTRSLGKADVGVVGVVVYGLHDPMEADAESVR